MIKHAVGVPLLFFFAEHTWDLILKCIVVSYSGIFKMWLTISYVALYITFCLYAFLVQITAHCFLCVPCSRVASTVMLKTFFHFYNLLVLITSFGFTCVAWYRVRFIFCTLYLVQREGSFLHNFSTHYFILSIFNFQNCPTLISKSYQ